MANTNKNYQKNKEKNEGKLEGDFEIDLTVKEVVNYVYNGLENFANGKFRKVWASIHKEKNPDPETVKKVVKAFAEFEKGAAAKIAAAEAKGDMDTADKLVIEENYYAYCRAGAEETLPKVEPMPTDTAIG